MPPPLSNQASKSLFCWLPPSEGGQIEGKGLRTPIPPVPNVSPPHNGPTRDSSA